VCLQFDTVPQTKVLSLHRMRNENVTHLQQMTRTHSQRNTDTQRKKNRLKNYNILQKHTQYTQNKTSQLKNYNIPQKYTHTLTPRSHTDFLNSEWVLSTIEL
jgi:hypothetical protein